MYSLLILLHVLGACVWVGGHLVLAVSIMPKALITKDIALLQQFEQAYERVGMPALLLQVLTGLTLFWMMLPNFSLWFSAGVALNHVLWLKLGLLLATVLFAIDARLRVIPHLSPANLVDLAWHVYPVTLLSVLFVCVGVLHRFGWWL